MAYDVQRFNELTKQMSAYAHYARDGHLQLAAARARRRDRARQLAEQVNSQLQLRFRAGGAPGRLRSPLSCSTRTTRPIGPRAASSTAASGQSGSPSATSACAPVSTPARGRPLPRRLLICGAVGPAEPRRDGGRDASRALALPTRAACSSVASGRRR